jgi:predicted O-linked N-acetylglucosamine transferase (SPINDLY family)
MEASPLMDQKGFVRELEEAYQAMWKIIIKNQKF